MERMKMLGTTSPRPAPPRAGEVGTLEQVEGVSQWRWVQVSKGPLRDMSNEKFVGFRACWLRQKSTCCQVEEMRHHLAFGGENKKPSEC